MLWLAAGAALIGLVAWLVLVRPVSLTSNLQARAEPAGEWAVALGFGAGPIAVSAVAAAAAPAFVACHLFGRQLLRLPLEPRQPTVSQPPRVDAPFTVPKSARALSARLLRFGRALDPVEVVIAWWESEGIFEVDSLDIDLAYSFRDVALTGRLLAALSVLSTLLPEQCQIRQTPSWASEDRAALALDGRLQIRLGRLLVAALRFVLKQRQRRAMPGK